jgi:hypothetical protein
MESGDREMEAGEDAEQTRGKMENRRTRSATAALDAEAGAETLLSPSSRHRLGEYRREAHSGRLERAYRIVEIINPNPASVSASVSVPGLRSACTTTRSFVYLPFSLFLPLLPVSLANGGGARGRGLPSVVCDVQGGR